MQTLVTIIHVIVALFLIVSVLLQSGKGGGVGAAFGGTSTEVFGGHGAGGFLAKVTSVMAGIFFCTSCILSYIGSNNDSVVSDIPAVEAPAAPVESAAAPVAAAAAAAAEQKAAVADTASDAVVVDAVSDAASDVAAADTASDAQ